MQAFPSSKYKAAIQKGQTFQARINLLNASNALLQSNISLISADITFDATMSTRRTCTISISDPTRSLVPDIATDKLAPFGNQFDLFVGPRYSDGTIDWIPMGRYSIKEVSADDSGASLVINVSGYDRSGRIARQALTKVYTIAKGTNYGTAIMNFLKLVDPTLTFAFSPTSTTTPQIVCDVNTDPWAYSFQMAQSIGMDLYFNRTGICTMRPVPNTSNLVSTWTYTDAPSTFGYMMNTISKTLVSDNVYNYIQIQAENAAGATVFTGIAKDTNILSPTYVGGSYGVVPAFFTSTIITTQAQANAAALAKLRYYMGASNKISIQGPPNPAQDEEDVIQIVRKKLSTNAKYFIDQITFSFSTTLASQTISARQVIQGTP